MFVAFIDSLKGETTKMLQMIELQSEEENKQALENMESALEIDEKSMDFNSSEIEANIEPQKQQKKIPRNDPCPCGSGKKYKNCCGKSGPKKGLLAKES